MAYCSNCGNKLEEGAKFCSNCGTAVESGNNNQRKTSYDGEIHKCPSCGEVLPSFSAVCPACGYELRGTKANNSVQTLVSKLQQIENEGSSKGSNKFGRTLGIFDNNDERKLSLIKSFPIPNTKEDIYEFAVLAATNIDVNSHDNYGKKLSDAWLAKLEQAYQKAKIVLDGDSRLKEIQKLYDNKRKSIEESKDERGSILLLIGNGVFFIIIAIIFFALIRSADVSMKKENERLEEIETKIEIALNDKDYKYALLNAERLIYAYGDEEQKRDWNNKRDYWIDKIIEEAAEDGVLLERPTDVSEPEEATPTFESTQEKK